MGMRVEAERDPTRNVWRIEVWPDKSDPEMSYDFELQDDGFIHVDGIPFGSALDETVLLVDRADS